jgi:hypothetical protein
MIIRRQGWELLQARNGLPQRSRRFGGSASTALQYAEAVETNGQLALKLGDRGIGIGQLLADTPRLLPSRQRLGRPPCLRQQHCDVVVTAGQVALQGRDVGVGIGQLPPDRQRLLVVR